MDQQRPATTQSLPRQPNPPHADHTESSSLPHILTCRERPTGEELPEILAAMDKLAGPLDHYLLADRRGDVMAARARLRDLLGRMA